MISKNENNYPDFEKIFGSKARIKILRTLSLNYELSISQIIKKTRLNHSCVLKHLNYLKSVNLIHEKQFGRIKIYRYKIENFKAKSLKMFIEIWEERH
ncbi:MAG: winged helix-turn-helix domain-containing protein [Candidatus Hodarchaeota archaeon]